MKKARENQEGDTTCGGRVRKLVGTPSFYLIINFLLSQWGDWMWQFSVGVYLSELSDKHLLLAALFGFIGGGCVLLLGGLIGDWVDRNARLKVVRVSLFLQNSSVALSALGVCAALKVKEYNDGSSHLLQHYLEAFVVAMAVIAQMSSVAYKIAIEKDWVVVISEKDSGVLTDLNAITRSLDLACKIFSPMSVGYIMTAVSTFASAVVIAVWNIVSMFVEYGLLSLIYRRVPALAVKKGMKEEVKENGKTNGEILAGGEEREMMMVVGKEQKDGDKNEKLGTKKEEGEEEKRQNVIRRTVGVMVGGWRTYAQQEIVWAGVSLALLYMTVLGFDAITVAYIISNDISAFLVGVSMGLAGFTGIIGAILFSKMAKRFGLNKTGVFSFSAEVACLTLAVASVWAPGTKFDPFATSTAAMNATLFSSTNHTLHNQSSAMASPLDPDTFQSELPLKLDLLNLINSPHNHTNNTSHNDSPAHLFFTNNISMILLLVGIILSRIGLWMSDLVVTQLLQENIAEEERGVVNGVQNSLNMLMEMLKFCLVICLPSIKIFGVHIILSFTFVSAAMFCFFWHAARSRKKRRIPSSDDGLANAIESKSTPLSEQEMVVSVPENPIV